MNLNQEPKFVNKREIYENNIFLINDLVKGFNFKRVINSIKFSLFFHNDRREVSIGYNLLQIKRILKFLFNLKLFNEYSFCLKEVKGYNNKEHISFATINLTKAIHYQNLEKKLIELLTDELLKKGFNIKHYSLSLSTKKYFFSWYCQFIFKLKALFILIFFTLRGSILGNKEVKKILLNDLDNLYIQIVNYLIEFRYYSKILKKHEPRFLITINENWMPQSVIIDCCKALKIPTIIYPHGIIVSTITLPSECDIFLFWNEQMKTHFNDFTYNKDNNLVLGALEPLANNHSSEPIEIIYDVLIISQLSVANDGENIIYKDIFLVWKKFIQECPTFKVCIKLHPFEGQKEYSFINDLFEHYSKQIQIIKDIDVPIDNLIRKSKRISTVSSSAITYGFYLKKPILLYCPPKNLENNIPISEKWKFKNVDELKEIIASEDTIYSNLNSKTYMWVDENEIRSNINELISKVVI